jgi:hypothetical protein
LELALAMATTQQPCGLVVALVVWDLRGGSCQNPFSWDLNSSDKNYMNAREAASKLRAPCPIHHPDAVSGVRSG